MVLPEPFVRSLLALTACACSVVSAIAYAAPAFADSAGPQSDESVFRGDIGFGLVVATSSRLGLFGGEAYWLAGGQTFHFDLGIQANPEVAVYFRGELGTILISNAAAAYTIVEWKPFPRWSLGTGVGAEAFFTWYGGSWAGFSVPVIVGFDVVHSEHRSLRIEFEQTGGYDEIGTAGWHSALTFKWVWN
jgi:hypothetical protein